MRALLRGARAIQPKAAPPDEGDSISLQDMPPNLVETVNELKNAVIGMRRAIAIIGTRLGPLTEAVATVGDIATNSAHSEGHWWTA
jgi:hypothetical protein